MALLSHAVGRTERLSAWNEVFALVLLFAGTLLFFALISYTPKDIPSWLWFSHVSPANHPAQNFIGPVGAIVAGICYQLIGVFASLLLAAVLLGFGASKLMPDSPAPVIAPTHAALIPHLEAGLAGGLFNWHTILVIVEKLIAAWIASQVKLGA